MSIKVVDVDNDVIQVELKMVRSVFVKLKNIAEEIQILHENLTYIKHPDTGAKLRLPNDSVTHVVDRVFDENFEFKMINDFGYDYFSMLLNVAVHSFVDDHRDEFGKEAITQDSQAIERTIESSISKSYKVAPRESIRGSKVFINES